MSIYYKFKALLFNKITAYNQKIVIEIGLNAYNDREAKLEAESIKNIIAIKLNDYLKQYPNRIYVK